MGLKEFKLSSLYLRNTLILEKSKVQEFGHLKNNIQKRLDMWKNKLLSKVRKATLTKAIVQAVPSYILTTFKVSCLIYNELDALIKQFWWGIDLRKW